MYDKYESVKYMQRNEVNSDIMVDSNKWKRYSVNIHRGKVDEDAQNMYCVCLIYY